MDSWLNFQLTSIMVEGARVRLRGWQQAAVALGSAVGALVDPRRADLIAALGETTGKPAFERVLERMKRNPEGRVRLLPTFYADTFFFHYVLYSFLLHFFCALPNIPLHNLMHLHDLCVCVCVLVEANLVLPNTPS